MSCRLKQERRGEGASAGRRADQFTRGQADVHRHRAGQGKTVDVDRRWKGSLVQGQQGSTVAVSISGDVILVLGGRGKAAGDGRRPKRRREHGVRRDRSSTAAHVAGDRRRPVRLRLQRLRRRQGIISFVRRRHVTNRKPISTVESIVQEREQKYVG